MPRLTLYRINRGEFIPEIATWIDQSFMQWTIRLVLWGFIGRMGVWIVTRTSTSGLVARLMLAALAAGVVLEALIAVMLLLNHTLAEEWFKTTPGGVLLLYPFVTGLWCMGIWLAHAPQHSGADTRSYRRHSCNHTATYYARHATRHPVRRSDRYRTLGASDCPLSNCLQQSAHRVLRQQ